MSICPGPGALSWEVVDLSLHLLCKGTVVWLCVADASVGLPELGDWVAEQAALSPCHLLSQVGVGGGMSCVEAP